MTKIKMLKFILVLAAVMTLAGCSGPKAEKAELRVSAASSLKNVMQELKGLFEQEQPGAAVSLNYASSGTLQQQIEQGAPVDVFVSAGKKQMDSLWNQGLVDNPRYIAGNKLVLVVSKEVSAGQQESPGDLRQLSAAGYEKIAVGAPETVPAGKYAREALEKAGIWAEIYPKLVMAKDVRQVLVYVETGNAEAGLVYKSDAMASDKIKTVFTVPAEYHSRIVYPAAVIKASQQQERADGFLRFLQTDKAQAVFKKHGFTGADAL